MDNPATTVFRAKYDSLKTSFEARLASLADTVRCAVEGIHQDQVLRQLNASASTREFAPAHARALIKRHLASERDAFFHGLAIQLADAEAEVTRCTRRNEELESSLSVLRGEATREERSRIEVTSVNADIQELRREYQIALEDTSAECRQLKVELSHAKRRSGVLKGERDQHAAQSRSLEQALADAGEHKLEAIRLERQLAEEKSASAKLSSELTRAQQSLDGLASSHQKLKVQAQSLQNDLNQRDRRLQLADVNRKKIEAQFREAVTSMEALMEEEAKDSASAIKNLRDKAVLTKDRLSTEVERLRGVNAELTANLAEAKAKSLEAELHLQAALKSKEIDASAATAREEVLRAEAEQARTRTDTMSQSLAEAIREQSGLLTETANAKVAAEVHEAKSRTAEVEMARVAGRETERAQALAKECIPSIIPGPGWGVDNLLAEKLQEASKHISELRTVLRQEVRRREAAEAEVSEAQGYLKSSRQELGELRHLAWKLEQMGRNSIDHIDEKNQAIKQLEDELHVRGVGGVEERADAPRAGTERGAPRIRQGASQRQEGYRDEGEKRVVAREPVSVETRRDGGEGEEDGRSARRRTLPQASPHALSSGKQILDGLSRLRSELQGVTTQLGETKAESEKVVRRCAEGVAVRVERLAQALRQAALKQVEAQTQALEAKAVGAKDKEAANALLRVVQGISTILLDCLGVNVPICLGNGSAILDQPGGSLERGLSELAAAIADAVSRTEENAKQALLSQPQLQPQLQPLPHGESSKTLSGQHHGLTLDNMVWGERSKDDFNMLAQLQKIEAESELQSLQARLDDMTEKYHRAVAEQETVDSAPLREERERAKEELARVARAHSGIVSALEATLAAEKSHCQDIRMRLERQTRDHQVALAEADQKLLQTQEELDKAQQALEQAQFALERETARRIRLDKKYSELEDRGLVSPRSVSPRVWRPEATSRKASGELERAQVDQPAPPPPLPRPSSARMVLEEARAKLGQDSLVVAATGGREETRVGGDGGSPDSRVSRPRAGREGEDRAEQEASSGVSPL